MSAATKTKTRLPMAECCSVLDAPLSETGAADLAQALSLIHI